MAVSPTYVRFFSVFCFQGGVFRDPLPRYATCDSELREWPFLPDLVIPEFMQAPHQKGDRLPTDMEYLIWEAYKKSYDMRNGPATHWKSPDHLGLRATFEAARNALNIQRVQTPDEGIYRCRVDFRINPTLTFISNLSVIVPPRRLLVYIDQDAEVRGVVGPFLEGETVTLNCRAEGGSPPPSVTWWEGAVLLDMTSEEETSEQVTNTLVVTSLTRRDLHRPLTCQASNTNLTRPLQTTVTINMSFPPLWVRILGDRAPLSAGRPYDLQCQIVGAKPPAAVTWRLQNSVLGGHRDEVSQEGNVTNSELRWTPSVKDAGKVISCQADSPVLEAGPMVDDWRLQIYYVPMTRLRPGRSLNLSNIEEGDDVYFECSIRANPWVYKISWLHEVRPPFPVAPMYIKSITVFDCNEKYKEPICGVIVSKTLISCHPRDGRGFDSRQVGTNGPADIRPPDIRPPDIRPPDIRPADIRPADIRPADIRPADIRPHDSRPADIRSADIGPHDIRPAEIRPPDIRPADIRPHDIRAADIRPADIRPADIRPPDRPAYLRPADIRPSDIGPHDIRPADIRPPDIRPADIRPHDIRPADIRAADIRSADIGPHDIRPADIRPPDIRPADIRPHDIRPADIRQADNRQANIRPADIRPPDIGPADIGPADIGPADIRQADNRQANIRAADIGPADIGPADIGLADIRPPDRPADMIPANLSPADIRPPCRPDPVHNCSAYNLTVSVTFVLLELYEPRSNRLLANVTNKVPTFAVPGLASGVAFMGVIYSTNEKGRGEMVSLQVYTVKDMPERPLAAVKPPPSRGKSSLPLNLNSIIALVVGGVGGLLVVGMIVCAVVRLRLERGAVVGGVGGRPGVGGCGRGGEGDMKSSMEEVGVAQGASPLLMPPPATTLKDLPPPPSSSPTDPDEMNPDVIPHSDADSWHIEGVNTISSSTLATGYATLPRTAHLHSHPATFQQACVGGSSAHYAELFLPGAAAAQPHHCHQPQRVLYAAFDQRERYPAPQQHYQSSAFQPTLPASSTPTPHHHQPHHTRAGHPQATQEPIWTPSATAIVRRHSLRRDPYTSNHEATVPLIASQKESSV
nr:uncharacterized protein LOC123758527 [Procambarus clarkii]